MSFTNPALEGDVTLLDARVTEKRPESDWGGPLVVLDVTMSNQEGLVLGKGIAEVELLSC